MASEIRVDKITSLSGVGTISPSPTGVEIAGITTVGILTSTGLISSGGALNGSRVNIIGGTPRLYLTDTNNNDDYQVRNENGTFEVRNDTDSYTVFSIEKGPSNTATFSNTTKVGSGITLSPDGDIFTTGITSFTNDVQFIGNSGISSITYDKSENQLNFVDNAQARFGTGADLEIFHSGSHSFIRDTGSGNLYIDSSQINLRGASSGNGESLATFTENGGVSLYHDNIERFRTYNEGIQVLGAEGGNAAILIKGDEGDDSSDTFRIIAGDGTDLYFQSYATGSYVTGLKLTGDGNGTVELRHSGTKRFATTGAGISVTQSSGGFSDFHHSGGNSGIRIAGPAASSGANLVFANNFANSVSDEWTIQLEGSTDDLIFKEGGVSGNEKLRILETGGITFNGDTATANALDDYEEGDWTPKQTDGGTNYTANHAKYVKIGRLVHITFDIISSSATNLTQIWNLPFTPSNYSSWHTAYYAINANTTGTGTAGYNSTRHGGLVVPSGGGYLHTRILGGTVTWNITNTDRLIGSASYETTA